MPGIDCSHRNPNRLAKALNISANHEDNARLLRVKHLLEKKEQKRLTVSEVIRRAVKELEQSLIATV